MVADFAPITVNSVLSKKRRDNMKTVNLMIVGVGGQGTLLTSRIIGKVASENGYDVKISEVHGMAQRGGSVVTFVRYGHKVYEPVCEEGTVDFLIAFERLEALRYAHYLKKDGKLIINDTRIDPMTVVIGAKEYPNNIIEELQKEHDVYVIDGGKITAEIGNNKVLNTVVLGFSARYIGGDQDLWLNVVEKTVPPKTVEINKLAFKKGYQA